MGTVAWSREVRIQIELEGGWKDCSTEEQGAQVNGKPQFMSLVPWYCL